MERLRVGKGEVEEKGGDEIKELRRKLNEDEIEY